MGAERSSRLTLGFPEELKGPGTWSGQIAEEDYVTQLTGSDIASVEAALRYFQGLGISHHTPKLEHFPLSPLLSTKLRYLSQAVHNGRFFAVLRGLNPDKYTEEENVIIYGGLALYVGRDRADMTPGSQSDKNQAQFPPNELTNSMVRQRNKAIV
ncbi:hypothetical protein QQS21_007015 [Conoideocrella luteorostrata]|uniref:Uncharacterized protein n=1 Tax=Conoideocrella luteorostrata TaxID=1105319 RepID=A0AAJ0CM02_9HYPO|nr:hypothetical protein QQS21_007015 [Conoideocrella luteorostrata]